ncbi:mechanosensitive ion channel family protein [Marinoscillum furvescens]|uniref:Mechanosensitive ion channel-like protein n=1 Tax=Marinoscillum furvescens DSM 4134 TaxID=1122208 RepID=A0A3D9L0G8_MARFU|nr:mechanosensitive ion channel family protein [Marinoscillum furvescens]RED96676.1 mechanosensitive ion channel-like protein [Marinoscillum furvescens DSM 4134]
MNNGSTADSLAQATKNVAKELKAEMEAPVETITSKINNWLDALVAMLPNMAVAVVLFILFLISAKAVQKVFLKLFKKSSQNKALENLFGTIVYYIVLGTGLFIILEVLQLDKAVTSLLAGVGVVGLALGFAFQDIAANFVSGIILAFRTPFTIGHIVKIGDYMGTVARTNLRVTVVKTFQGQEVYIPNKDVLQSPIENFSILGQYRIDLAVGISYGDDLEKVEELVLETIHNLEGVIRHDDMIFTYTAFGDSSINFEIKFWVDYPDHPGFLAMRTRAIKAIKKAFDENDITIPFPIRTLDFGIKGGETLSQMQLNTTSGSPKGASGSKE